MTESDSLSIPTEQTKQGWDFPALSPEDLLLYYSLTPNTAELSQALCVLRDYFGEDDGTKVFVIGSIEPIAASIREALSRQSEVDQLTCAEREVARALNIIHQHRGY